MSALNAAASAQKTSQADAGLYWIHCNKCFELYVHKKRRFYLFACNHVSCEVCCPVHPSISLADSPSFKCFVCQKMVRGRQLNNTMPSHIKELFHPQAWLDNLPAIRILRFQQMHREHFRQGMAKKRRVIQRMEKNFEQWRDKVKKTYEEFERMRVERRGLERRVLQIIKERKKVERRAAGRARPPSDASLLTFSSIDTPSSYINTCNMSKPSTRPRYPKAPTSAGRGTFMPFAQDLMTQRLRMPSPSMLSHVVAPKVQSFTQERSNSFLL